MILRLMRVTVARNTELEVRSAREKDDSVRALASSARRCSRPSGRSGRALAAPAGGRRGRGAASPSARFPFRHDRALPADDRARRPRRARARPELPRRARVAGRGRSARWSSSGTSRRRRALERATAADRAEAGRQPTSASRAGEGDDARRTPSCFRAGRRRARARASTSTSVSRLPSAWTTRELDRVARLVRRDRRRAARRPTRRRLAVDRDDHVAAELVALAGDDDLRRRRPRCRPWRRGCRAGRSRRARPCRPAGAARPRRPASTSWSVTPRNARSTCPSSSSCATTLLTVFDGTAKPMPTLPPPPFAVSICELTPITRPSASISGPPELPLLIGASVWMTWSIV